MENRPLVSIVTPCLNGARFLEETIQSVLAQNYPAIEYIVMDGGSTDGTLAILRRYADRLTFQSQPDRGPAEAINRGFGAARGRILAWLSSDDTILPGTVQAAVEHLVAHPEAAAVYGHATWRDTEGRLLRRYPTRMPWRANMLRRECGICQPACFMRREAVEAVGLLDSTLETAFDYDLWIRLSMRFPFVAVDRDFATSRMHRDNISLRKKRQMFEECIELLQRHYGYVPPRWVYGYLCFLETGRDQFFEPTPHSPARFLRSLARGLAYNRCRRWRYAGDWIREVFSRST